MADGERTRLGRLALRHEGRFWNAYFAPIDSMDGAILIGSIAMAAVVDNPERKEAFMAMMREFVGDMIEAHVGGSEVSWGDPAKAPEAERSGHG